MSESMRRLAPILFCTLAMSVHAADSVCFGTPGNGRLDGGVQIRKSGKNFVPYSSVGVTLGRTYVHAKVADVVADAYDSLARSLPNTTFVYGESGWSEGGRIKPHRTHQNGLAIDFMVPVLNRDGRSVPLPSNVMNKFGYGIEFDGRARYDDLTIDFEAIAEHLHALYLASKQHRVGIGRVIFDPRFIPRLYETKCGAFIKKNITFMQGQAWVRHDEHYHVDFSIPCKPLDG